jgi:hypothetical protein
MSFHLARVPLRTLRMSQFVDRWQNLGSSHCRRIETGRFLSGSGDAHSLDIRGVPWLKQTLRVLRAKNTLSYHLDTVLIIFTVFLLL